MSHEAPWASSLNPVLGELSAYTPASGEYPVRLDANEAPNLLSDAARQKLLDATSKIDWHRYPDAGAEALRGAIARRCGVSPEETLAGVGSDELIALLLQSFQADPQGRATVLTLSPSFVMYRMTARIHGHQVLEIPLDADWDMNLDAMLKALEFALPRLIFIASPNNPTGTLVSMDRLRTLVERAAQSIVVVDEAYIDYAATDQLQLLREYDNVVVLRTLSKIGFAALRLGWLIARPSLVRELNKARLPYNLCAPSQTLASVVLSELGDELEHTAKLVVAERERITQAISRLPGLHATPSQANFVWFRSETPAAQVYEALKGQGILLRSFHKSGGRLKHHLRVTVGTREENDCFLRALEEAI